MDLILAMLATPLKWQHYDGLTELKSLPGRLGVPSEGKVYFALHGERAGAHYNIVRRQVIENVERYTFRPDFEPSESQDHPNVHVNVSTPV